MGEDSRSGRHGNIWKSPLHFFTEIKFLVESRPMGLFPPHLFFFWRHMGFCHTVCHYRGCEHRHRSAFFGFLKLFQWMWLASGSASSHSRSWVLVSTWWMEMSVTFTNWMPRRGSTSAKSISSLRSAPGAGVGQGAKGWSLWGKEWNEPASSGACWLNCSFKDPKRRRIEC